MKSIRSPTALKSLQNKLILFSFSLQLLSNNTIFSKELNFGEINVSYLCILIEKGLIF